MTGLLTTMSVGGITQDKLKMLNDLNEEINKKTDNIVQEATSMDKALNDCKTKVKSLRKDLQASARNYFECETACKVLKKDLEQSKESASKLQQELNDSQQTMSQVFEEDVFDFGTPVKDVPSQEDVPSLGACGSGASEKTD